MSIEGDEKPYSDVLMQPDYTPSGARFHILRDRGGREKLIKDAFPSMNYEGKMAIEHDLIMHSWAERRSGERKSSLNREIVSEIDHGSGEKIEGSEVKRLSGQIDKYTKMARKHYLRLPKELRTEPENEYHRPKKSKK